MLLEEQQGLSVAEDIEDEAGVPCLGLLQLVACLMYSQALNLLLVITRQCIVKMVTEAHTIYS